MPAAGVSRNNLPLALRIGGDGIPRAPAGLDGDMLARRSESPDGVGGLLLQDYVIAKEVGEPNFGLGCEPGDEGEGVFHTREQGSLDRRNCGNISWCRSVCHSEFRIRSSG